MQMTKSKEEIAVLPKGTVDCDVHPAVQGMYVLLPYLDEHWQEQVSIRGIDGLDLRSYPLNAPLTGRPDWRPAAGKAGSDFSLLQSQALDAFNSDHAILNCLYGAHGVYNEDFAAALCRAINEWIVAEWLDQDSRLRASMVVPWQNAEFAVDEIERLASDRRFVQILFLAMGETPLGRRRFWPIYAAAERHDLPVCIHAGSTYHFSPSACGWTSYHYEDYMVQVQAFQAQIMSLIGEGVFSKFPNFVCVLAESGVTWLPNIIWRSTQLWRALRMEIPWVDRSPADIIRTNFRLTTQPFDAPEDPEIVMKTIEQIGSDEILLFSTDYPHWQFDGQGALVPGLSADLVQKICVDNPIQTYPRLKEMTNDR